MIKKFSIFVFFIFLFILSVSTTYAIELDPTNDLAGKKITFLGDSLVEGIMVDEADRLTTLIANELNVTTINLGVSGRRVTDTSVGRTDSFIEVVDTLDPTSDYIVLWGGYNDWGNAIPLLELETDYNTVIDYILANYTAEIIIFNYLKSSESASFLEFNSLLETIADDTDEGTTILNTNRIHFLDLYNIGDVTTEELNFYTYDGLHLSEAGHRLVANIFISFMAGENLANDITWVADRWYNNATNNFTDLVGYNHSNPLNLTVGNYYSVYAKNTTTTVSNSMGAGFTDLDVVTFEIDNQNNPYKTFKIADNTDYVIVNSRTLTLPDYSLRLIINKMVITFDSNGGTPVETDYAENTAVLEPVDPVKSGYVFAGWYLEDGTLYDFTDPVVDNITLTARWEYNANIQGIINLFPIIFGIILLSGVILYIKFDTSSGSVQKIITVFLIIVVGLVFLAIIQGLV